MEIKANFIALKSGSGIHQFLGKISNQGEVQIASYKMNPLEYLLWNRLTGFPFPPRNVYSPEGRHAVPSQRNGFYVTCWARLNRHPAVHPEGKEGRKEGRKDGWMDE
jgi:hypothetical protein